MADYAHSKEDRSYNMSRIRSTETKPKKIVRRFLFSRGFRYRKMTGDILDAPIYFCQSTEL